MYGIVCPNCGQVLDRVEDHFHGTEVWKYEGGKFKRIPSDTIETYCMICSNCGRKLPEKVANEIAGIMVK